MKINQPENLVFASHSSPHHASHSGYSKLIDQFPNSIIVTGKTGLPYKISKALSSMARTQGETYNHLSVNKELCISNLMLKKSNGIVHFLNAERDIHFSTYLKRIRSWDLAATFHKPPSLLDEVFRNTKFINRLDGAVAVGTNQLDWMNSHLRCKSIQFIPHGVDTDFFSPQETVSDNQIIFVGQHLRNFDLLERTFCIIRKRFPKIKLVGVVRKEFIDKLPKEGKVLPYSAITDEQLRKLYRQSAALLMPLIDSTACNSILEAMACGLPIVTNNVGGIKDYVSSNEGFVLESKAELMGEAAIHLIENRPDNLKMRKNARKRSLDFSWSKIGLEMSRFYNSLAY